jgi:hypothetical protein
LGADKKEEEAQSPSCVPSKAPPPGRLPLRPRRRPDLPPAAQHSPTRIPPRWRPSPRLHPRRSRSSTPGCSGWPRRSLAPKSHRPQCAPSSIP